jgi:hypothetical protein
VPLISSLAFLSQVDDFGLPRFSSISEADIPDMDDDEDRRMIFVGICAMAKKSKSQPMREILERLDRFEYIQTIIFEEDTVLHEPVENWPIVDCLISFYSKGVYLCLLNHCRGL